jgi:hypothetical protein
MDRYISIAEVDRTFNAWWSVFGQRPTSIQLALEQTRKQIGGKFPPDYIPPPQRQAAGDANSSESGSLGKDSSARTTQATQIASKPGGAADTANVLGGSNLLPANTLVKLTDAPVPGWCPIVVIDGASPYKGKSGFVLVNLLKAEPPPASDDPASDDYSYSFTDDPLSAGGFGPKDARILVRPQAARTTLIRPRSDFLRRQPATARLKRKSDGQEFPLPSFPGDPDLPPGSRSTSPEKEYSAWTQRFLSFFQFHWDPPDPNNPGCTGSRTSGSTTPAWTSTPSSRSSSNRARSMA